MFETLKRPSLQILLLSTIATWIVGLFSTQSWSLYAVGGCWLVFGGYIWSQLLRKRQLWLAAVPIFFVIVIGIGISLPVELFNKINQPVDHWLMQVGSPLMTGKIGHVFCFAMLTLFMLLVRRRLDVRASELVWFIILLAVATEGMQLFVAGRTTRMSDLLLDLVGAIIGYAIFLIYKSFSKDGDGLIEKMATRFKRR